MTDRSYTSEPPLDSDVRWMSIQVVAERMLERLRYGPDVARDLAEALSQGRLRCMARHIHTGERRLMAPVEWAALKLEWWGIDPQYRNYSVEVGYRELEAPNRRKLFRETLYIWQPDLEALWSPDAGIPPIAPQPKPAPTPIISAQAWFKQALKDDPRQPGEGPSDYAKRLYPLMMNAGNIKKPWALETLERRIKEVKPAPPL